MAKSRRVDPLAFRGVMVSSTFTDLVEHRKALIKAIDANGFKAVDMENDAAKPIPVLQSSLEMVRDAAAYAGVISRKYGQVPDDPKNNPHGLSLVELEFDEALRQERPLLMFLMGPDHLVRESDIDTDEAKKAKLQAFRERALAVNVCKVFNDAQEFEVAAMQSVAELRRRLDLQALPALKDEPELAAEDGEDIPEPPDLYAEPAYIVSNQFVGRENELQTLSDWAAPADPHPILLFEAIGGAGKSMLTWEWTTRHSTTIRTDWAGRFWYSFYEKGAVMADFCRRALAYMTRRPLRDFSRKKTMVLTKLLLAELRERPWLLVLDGLERVLVSYHRFDAAQVLDEDAGTSDQIAHRDPRAAIQPEDEELLRTLATAHPSKLLVTSRLVPRVMLNQAGQAIPGVLHVRLPGLRPTDAERLLRSLQVRGSSPDMQDYLQRHCDCHPLVTTVLAGLINNYLQDRGNFDAWAEDAAGGAALNLAELDLVQKRNHILLAAIEALPEKSRELLSTLALLFESVDYETLAALSPYVPPVQENPDPGRPRQFADYQTAIANRQAALQDADNRKELQKTVVDLESRGLLQYDWQSRRYDLHPVVRGVVMGQLRAEDRQRYGQPIVDYFSARPHNPYENATTLDDVRSGVNVVSALLHMGRYSDATAEYRDELSDALFFNLEAYRLMLAILRPFFERCWDRLSVDLDQRSASYLLNEAGGALSAIGEHDECIRALTAALLKDLSENWWFGLIIRVGNISWVSWEQNRLATAIRCGQLALELAIVMSEASNIFRTRLDRFNHACLTGRTDEAEELWALLDPMGREWPRYLVRPGLPEAFYARFLFQNGRLSERYLADAQQLAEKGKARQVVRALLALRGHWHLTRGEWTAAADSLQEAVRMAHEIDRIDAVAETQLALVNTHLGRLSNPLAEAEQLSVVPEPSHIDLAALWLVVGDREQATKHALAAYRWAWADGEPFVRRYEVNRARSLLQQLGVPIPNLSPYDPSKDVKLPWEDAVAEAIEKLRAEKANEESAE
jgi:hypothetical protein